MGCGCIGVPHASRHVHACMHICTCMLNMTWMPPWRRPFGITIHVYFSVMHVHMHVCMCMNVGACGGHT